MWQCTPLPTASARQRSHCAHQALSVARQGWPFPAETEVWVQSSTSGAAPQTNAAREAPWLALAERLRAIPWPRRVTCTIVQEPG